MTDLPILAGDQVVLRTATEADLPLFAAMFESPEVSHWWKSPPEDLGDDDEVGLAIEVGGEVVGMIQYTEVDVPEYRSAGIDIFLSPAHHGHGLGTDAVRTLARFLFEQRDHHRLTIDPAAANVRAIACYRKVGFKPVGLMRQYERGADGTWHDGLLMDLLRDELS